jgi:hypothetical protein
MASCLRSIPLMCPNMDMLLSTPVMRIRLACRFRLRAGLCLFILCCMKGLAGGVRWWDCERVVVDKLQVENSSRSLRFGRLSLIS